MHIFDDIIKLIFYRRKEICINKNSSYINIFIPKIYYIGDGKSGSSSIMMGFPNINTAHWHNVGYFENIYDTKLLTNNNYDLYDLIIYIGNKYNFKPIIIESTRIPINLEISRIFQHIKIDRKHGPECELCQINKINNQNTITEIIKKNLLRKKKQIEPYSIEMYKKHFDIDLLSEFSREKNYYFNDSHNIILLFLKFENITEWNKIINYHLPYKFVLNHNNKTTHPFYENIKQNLKFTKEEIQLFLDHDYVNCFYTNDEIDKIKQHFIEK
jgi:hypothetical protein